MKEIEKKHRLVYVAGITVGGAEFYQYPEKCYPSLEEAINSFEGHNKKKECWVDQGDGVWIHEGPEYPKAVVFAVEVVGQLTPNFCERCG